MMELVSCLKLKNSLETLNPRSDSKPYLHNVAKNKTSYITTTFSHTQNLYVGLLSVKAKVTEVYNHCYEYYSNHTLLNNDRHKLLFYLLHIKIQSTLLRIPFLRVALRKAVGSRLIPYLTHLLHYRHPAFSTFISVQSYTYIFYITVNSKIKEI